MALAGRIVSLLKRVLAFNQFERDRWVAAQAASIPAKSRVLDVGAGSCPYRHLFTHYDYRAHDFSQLKPSVFKHYGQESLRFASMLAPWRGADRLAWLPLWLLSLPWLAVLCPLLGQVLDKLDADRAFTVGYHVTAIRCS